MTNALGNTLSNRPTEGYSKNIQATDPTILDSAGNPVVGDVGDAHAMGFRVGGGWLRMLALTLLYQAAGGLATGQNIFEFLSAAGMEIDPSLTSLDNDPQGLFAPTD